MSAKPTPSVWTFDDFHPGSELDRLAIALDNARLASWKAIYGDAEPGNRIPSGMLVAAMMEGYLKAIQPRPPGNIHASQKLAFCGATVRPGDRLDVSVSCIDKTMRKERRWVTFGVTLRKGPQDVLRGEIRTIWAK